MRREPYGRKPLPKSIVEWRHEWIRSKLAAEWYVGEITDAAEMEPMFRSYPHARNPKDRRKVMARSSIRDLINKTKKIIRSEVHDDPVKETKLAYERLVCAFRMAQKEGNTKDMVAAQKLINRMIGIQRDRVEVAFDPELIRQQMEQMTESTRGK